MPCDQIPLDRAVRDLARRPTRRFGRVGHPVGHLALAHHAARHRSHLRHRVQRVRGLDQAVVLHHPHGVSARPLGMILRPVERLGTFQVLVPRVLPLELVARDVAADHGPAHVAVVRLLAIGVGVHHQRVQHCADEQVLIHRIAGRVVGLDVDPADARPDLKLGRLRIRVLLRVRLVFDVPDDTLDRVGGLAGGADADRIDLDRHRVLPGVVLDLETVLPGLVDRQARLGRLPRRVAGAPDGVRPLEAVEGVGIAEAQIGLEVRPRLALALLALLVPVLRLAHDSTVLASLRLISHASHAASPSTNVGIGSGLCTAGLASSDSATAICRSASAAWLLSSCSGCLLNCRVCGSTSKR